MWVGVNILVYLYNRFWIYFMFEIHKNVNILNMKGVLIHIFFIIYNLLGVNQHFIILKGKGLKR